MSKITGVLLSVGVMLWLTAGPAGAANNGTADPQGLIASAAIQPFWDQAGNFTLIEVTSPINDNGLNLAGALVSPTLHVVYFNNNCVRLVSRPQRVSYKGAIMFLPQDDIPVPDQPLAGLATIAHANAGQLSVPIPNEYAIHVRGHWINFGADFARVVDPIAVNSPQSDAGVVGPVQQTYSPLRSAASFGAPIQIPPFNTLIHFICPSSAVIGVGSELSPALGFPVPNFSVTTGGFGVLYDFQENPLVDFLWFCNCNSMFALESFSPLYSLILLTYTELFTYQPTLFAPPVPAQVLVPAVFTAYRELVVDLSPPWLDPSGGDSFARLANGSAYNYRVNGSTTFGLGAPFFTPGLR